MPKYNVLIVDDSPFMRKVFSDVVDSDEAFRVVATASNGEEAVELAAKLEPDIITMDMEMPHMNGLEALHRIMEHRPTPIIMLSAVTDNGTRDTIKALQYGAFDFIRKPDGSGKLDIHLVGEQLLEKLHIAVASFRKADSRSGELPNRVAESGSAELPEMAAESSVAEIANPTVDFKVGELSNRVAESGNADFPETSGDSDSRSNDPIAAKDDPPSVKPQQELTAAPKKAGADRPSPPPAAAIPKEPLRPDPKREEKAASPQRESRLLSNDSVTAEKYKPEPIKPAPLLNRNVEVAESAAAPKTKPKEAKREAAKPPSSKPEQAKLPTAKPEVVKPPPAKLAGNSDFRHVVAIGTSTGGPRALHEVLMGIPPDFPAPVLVVQHMPPKFTLSLAQRLDSFCAIHVREAVDGERLETSTAYIAPGGKHMTLAKDGAGHYRIKLNEEGPRNGHRPAVDVLFESLIGLRDLTRHAVLMTGMGSDGAKGMKALLEDGAATAIAEDESTCVVYGMPRSAVEIGAVTGVVPLPRIAPTLVQEVCIR